MGIHVAPLEMVDATGYLFETLFVPDIAGSPLYCI